MNGYMSLQNGAKLESMHGYSNGRKVERFRREDACRITLCILPQYSKCGSPPPKF